MRLCDWCHILDGRLPGRDVTAGCVHEHFKTLALCPAHEQEGRTEVQYCQDCLNVGAPQVPVSIVTPALS